MKLLLLLPLLWGLMSPAIAHNDANGGDETHAGSRSEPASTGTGIEVPEGWWWVI